MNRVDKNFKLVNNEINAKYDELLLDYKKISSELYNIKNSRSYKLSLFLRKLINPLKIMKKLFGKTAFLKRKIKRFVNDTNKIAIVPCSFEFDEFVNQRPINYAKFLADNGYKVIYVAWQWDKNSFIKKANKIVYKNIIQIPLYNFLDLDINFEQCSKKLFYINFPNEIFLNLTYLLRVQEFIIHYDIMDEWEEFQKVGQANWYQKSIEEQLINESDYVSAVSSYLCLKFKYLRKDIDLVPNGYFTKTTGEKNKNIALSKVTDGIVNIGYFGHLTNSWFNWELLFNIAKNNNHFIFHIIGYGLEESILETIKQYSNIIFYGKIPTNQLFKYVKNWNIGIILFKESNLAKAVDPIKIYEYLYMGLPTIVSGIEHLASYPRTYVIKNEKEFVNQVNNIIQLKNGKNIDKFLNDSTWEARFNGFMKKYKNRGLSKFYEK